MPTYPATSKSRESRYIFVRRYWFGDSVGEIAKDLRMQENAVSVRLNRIRNNLKDYLKKEGYHPLPTPAF